LARADAYTYSGSGNVDFSFTTSLTHAELLNLPAGTDITATVTASSLFAPMPPTDNAGVALGVNHSQGLSLLDIGTDELGNITSWFIQETYLAAYAVSPATTPFCIYEVQLQTNGGTAPLLLDRDTGHCPSSAPVDFTGAWSPTFTVDAVPEPGTGFVLAGGLLWLWASRRRYYAPIV
jgi:hypothetical protein